MISTAYNLPSAQSCPCHPAAQLHTNDPSLFVQVAPLTQSPTPSFASHSFISVREVEFIEI